MDKNIPVISIVGIHNSGKTTFIEAVIRILSQRGYKITAIKHDPKGKAQTDTPGKDSYRFFHSGAKEVFLVSPDRITHYIKEEKPDPSVVIKHYASPDTDLVIIEGFKNYPHSHKFEVIRKAENRQPVLPETEVKGYITDYYKHSLTFDINKPQEFADYIEQEYIKKRNRL
ncbi:MAG: molybdopterin-guanine dinucleotide biosynthesis protein B [Aquificae bacterium]|nr:molybdopterin-guanine dinucleotide biosynthesis protein B [Aquificota bacterium]